MSSHPYWETSSWASLHISSNIVNLHRWEAAIDYIDIKEGDIISTIDQMSSSSAVSIYRFLFALKMYKKTLAKPLHTSFQSFLVYGMLPIFLKDRIVCSILWGRRRSDSKIYIFIDLNLHVSKIIKDIIRR